MKTKLTFDDAKHKVIVYCDLLISNKIRFTFQHLPENHCFSFTARDGADAMKSLIPQTNIEHDIHKVRFAFLVVSYE